MAIAWLMLGATQSFLGDRVTPTAAQEAFTREVTAQAEYPWGGRTIFPDYRLVATYGSPVHPALGVLGERPVEKSIRYTKRLARQYTAHSKQPVLPAMEIIASVASASPTNDGDYSQEVPRKLLRQWVQAAGEQGVYVVLDLQPGRDSFLSQAKWLEDLLKEPHVGLALDPEWRLKRHQVHLEQIGSVQAREVNKVAAWLADLTAEHGLPQKVFMVHQFRHDMIDKRQMLKTDHAELAYVIHMDGQGSQASKKATYSQLLHKFPKHARTGWKNFFDEDKTLRSPAATLKLSPAPWFISYQ